MITTVHNCAFCIYSCSGFNLKICVLYNTFWFMFVHCRYSIANICTEYLALQLSPEHQLGFSHGRGWISVFCIQTPDGTKVMHSQSYDFLSHAVVQNQQWAQSYLLPSDKARENVCAYTHCCAKWQNHNQQSFLSETCNSKLCFIVRRIICFPFRFFVRV